MKEISVTVGKTYAVTTAGSCTVTDADGRELCTAESGSQSYFTANGRTVTISDDSASVTQANFKQALAALGLLGGGDTLPKGYTRLEFLESTGTQYIKTDLPANRLSFRIVSSHYASSGGSGLAITAVWNDAGKYGIYANTLNSVAINLQKAGESTTVWTMFGLPNVEDIFTTTVDFQKMTCTFEGGDRSPYVWSIPERYATLEGFTTMALFAEHRWSNYAIPLKGSIYSFSANYDGIPAANFIPALDSVGTPCMFDRVSKQPFRNAGTGQFIAGVKDSAQLRTVLRKLPDRTGQDMGTLTLSIPAEANTPEMQELLDSTKAQKNWNLITQERAAEVATYSLRRVRKVVWVRRVQDKNGSYVDADGERWQTEWCSAIYSPLGNDPALHGYEPFDSVEQAIEAWGLVPYQYPEEELSTEA